MDYAKSSNSEFWLRHPVLGDPSFDTFEKKCTMYQSKPPFEWTVNCSLMRDFDGAWYCYVGRYPKGYFIENIYPKYLIYRSYDCGKSWKCLGYGFSDNKLYFKNSEYPAESYPDAVVLYDYAKKKYLMTFDWGASLPGEAYSISYSGSAVAWADTPAGPFVPEENSFAVTKEINGSLGRFNRIYASTVIPRKNDYLALILCDSDQHFSWGLACKTAVETNGEWTELKMLLSVDRPEYFPAPVEFYPAYVLGDTVYAPATSVAGNRNYQALFAAKLEDAHRPEAWKLINDGNLWHSRNDESERLGIWGQTYSGFVHDGIFTVAYPSLDSRWYGNINIAQRRLDTPVSDGFTISGHSGKSISPLLAAYSDFTLVSEFKLSGTVEFAFDYHGVLGPNISKAVSVLSAETLNGYTALKIQGGNWELLSRKNGREHIYASGNTKTIISINITKKENTVLLYVNNELVQTVQVNTDNSARPIALIVHELSIFECNKFKVDGDISSYSLRYNAYDALLGAGESLADWEKTDYSICDAYLGGEGRVAKWNIIGSKVHIDFPDGGNGIAGIYIDGEKYGRAELPHDKSFKTEIRTGKGRHSVLIKQEKGTITVGSIEVMG